MAVDFSILARVPTIGSQIMAGQEAGREAAARNMLLQQRALEFQQAQEERKLAMEERRMQREAAAAQVARRGQLAQLLRQSGMDPSDMQSATQFYAAALEANEPTAIAAAKDWLSIARETAQSRAAGAEYQGIMGGGAPAPAPAPMATPMVAAPAPMATPMTAPAVAPMAPEAPALDERGVNRAAWMAKAGLEEDIAPPPVNQLAPQAPAAPPVNQLAAAPAPAAAPTPAPAKDDPVALRAEAQRLEAQQQRLRQSSFKANQERAKDLEKPIERLYERARDIEKAAKPNREALSPLGKLLAEQAALPPGDPRRAPYDAAIEKESQRPEKGTPLAQYLRERDEIARANPADPRLPLYEDVIKRMREKPSTTVNVGVSTERKYGEQFAGKVAERDDALWNAAQDAPTQAENANRILSTLATGKAITGPLADVKLNIARALNVVGVDNADTISKTEALVTSMAENTLNAIKTSGLGTGQGFTDKDLKFLQEAKSGNINFQPDTIRQLAELAHRAAEKTAEKWNARVKQIPKSALEGTGVSTEPIKVPKRASSVTAATRPSGVGPDWTLMQDANGKKAWVSPDRKQVKEVD